MIDENDFSDFVVARWGSLVRAAILLGCTTFEAEDMAQAALLRCYVSWRRVSRASNIDAYVYRVLLNSINDSNRKSFSREIPVPNIPDSLQPATDRFADVDEVDAVRRALGQLPPQQRSVIVLRYYANLTETQIAETLSIAPGTVKSRTHRALRQLCTLMSSRGDWNALK